MNTVGMTDIGLMREENQDYFLFYEPEDPSLLEKKGAIAIVADGVGGLKAGGIASYMAVETLRETYYRNNEDDIEYSLRLAIEEANRRVYKLSQQNPEYRGMATTCTSLIFRDGIVAFGHVGDSRAYIIRRGRLELLTEDHTLVNRLLKESLIKEEEAVDHPHRNVITRALGLEEEILVDTGMIELQKDDLFLLCTDGLYSLVDDDEIERVIAMKPIREAAEELISIAKERGSKDNITIQIIKPGEGVDERKTEEIRIEEFSEKGTGIFAKIWILIGFLSGALALFFMSKWIFRF